MAGAGPPLFILRGLVTSDPVALRSWSTVVDEIVTSPAEQLRIKAKLESGKHGQLEEGVLQSLELWFYSGGGKLDELLEVLRAHHLNALAAKIQEPDYNSLLEEFQSEGSTKPSTLRNLTERHGLNSVADKIATVHSGCNYSLNHIWHDVGELPHDFVRRDSELETTHQRLSHHSNWSVDANIVCISGPPDCGKSALARRYAFENCDFYGGNVVWIHAESTECMRVSFEKLAWGIGVGATGAGVPARVYNFFKDRKCLFVFDGLQRMEDFNQFRPKIISPWYSTPYLLVTSRESGLAPAPQNEIRIPHYRVAVLKSIEEMSKPAAELAKLISYVEPGKVSVRFLEEVFEQFKRSGLEFQSCLRLLEKHKLLQVSDPGVVIEQGVQEVIRSSLSKEEEASALRTMSKTHQHLLKKRTKDLADEGTAHRLHLLHFDLKSASLLGYFCGLWSDIWDHSAPSSTLKISLQAYEILKNRFGEEDGATIEVRRIAGAHYHMEKYPEAIGILESLIPLAKATLGDGHRTTGEILRSLYYAYSKNGDRERANQYKKDWVAWKEMWGEVA